MADVTHDRKIVGVPLRNKRLLTDRGAALARPWIAPATGELTGTGTGPGRAKFLRLEAVAHTRLGQQMFGV